MKRIFSLILAFTILCSLCACQGNFGSVNLQDPIPIPDDGIIKSKTLEKIQSENAIGIFTGESNGFAYEWTIFGSDLQNLKDVNLLVHITKEGSAVKVKLSQQESFGVNFLLSIHLDEKWPQISATAYYQQQAFCSASVTGSKTTILNISLDAAVQEFIILADDLPPEESIPSDGSQPSQGKDQYLTDPIPAGKPKPVEPENQEVNKGKTYTCTFFIECSTILNNLDQLDPEKLEMVPSNGVILAKNTVTFYEGESVFDVLQRVCKEYGIHLESSWTPIYNSAYIEGIHNLYEFDCGALSGWMYQVNGWYPNYGCSRYQLQDGDTVEWRYTCDLGEDVGRGMG